MRGSRLALLLTSLGALALGCDDGAADAAACDGATCSDNEGTAPDASHHAGHSPAPPARDSGAAIPDGAGSSEPRGGGSGADPVADAGPDAAMTPDLECEDDRGCPNAGLASCRQSRCIAGACVVVEDDDAVPEDDGNACTEDVCRGGGARHPFEPPGTACAHDGGSYCDGHGACVACVLPSHCGSGVCQDGECRPAPCGNGVLDSGETDVDCGGECGGCGPDALCVLDQDCTGMDCAAGTCAPSCNDGVQNQGESDVDCGAACAGSLCEDGDACGDADDCASGFCHPVSSECATPSCSDGVRNGSETAIDCGGMTSGVSCPRCPVPCTDNWECEGVSAGGIGSGLCYDGRCVDDVHGCTVENSTDFTNLVTASQTAPITIQFGGALGPSYAPRCLKITMGTRIRLVGDFASHPLVGGSAGALPPSTGPFTTRIDSGTFRELVMDDCAAYPYHCDQHGATGMTGAVIVLLP